MLVGLLNFRLKLWNNKFCNKTRERIVDGFGDDAATAIHALHMNEQNKKNNVMLTFSGDTILFTDFIVWA